MRLIKIVYSIIFILSIFTFAITSSSMLSSCKKREDVDGRVSQPQTSDDPTVWKITTHSGAIYMGHKVAVSNGEIHFITDTGKIVHSWLPYTMEAQGH